MAEQDEIVGRNARSFREALGLSQADVAQAMTDAGVSGFYPQTVLKVEKGTRSLKLTEAVTLAVVLKVEPGDLAGESTAASDDVQGYQLFRGLFGSFEGAVDGLQTFGEYWENANTLLKTLDLSPKLRESILGALKERTLKAVIRQAVVMEKQYPVGDTYREMLNSIRPSDGE